MKFKIYIFLISFVFLIGFPHFSQANGVRRHTRAVQEKPIVNTPHIRGDDPHVKIIGWNPQVPLNHILKSIHEGVTDQLTILRLFSAPNIITRSDHEKETWIYHWKWSYNNTKSQDTTIISMDHPGLRLKNNKRPVSMVVTFNDKNIVESYDIRLLKIKRDAF